MNFTQEQISDILLEYAKGNDGFNSVMKISLEVLMKSERLYLPLKKWIKNFKEFDSFYKYN